MRNDTGIADSENTIVCVRRFCTIYLQHQSFNSNYFAKKHLNTLFYTDW